MKITLIGPVYPYRGGIAHYTTSLALALQRAGHEVITISFKRQYPAFLYPGESDKDPSKNPVRVNAEYLLDPLYPWTWLQTAKKILAAQPDLVVIQWWVTFWGLAYGALARLVGKKIKTAYLIHNVLPHENRSWDRLLARFALGPASAFIVQASSQHKRLQELLPKARIYLCNHPMYGRFSEQMISKPEARKFLGLPDEASILLFFGIVRPYKGLKYLLDALSRSDDVTWLIVAGEFWEDVELYQRQIETLGLTRRVVLFNRYIPNEEAHWIFSAADALVAPYIGGTQSGVVELAHGYGLPVIMTDIIAPQTQNERNDVYIVPAKDTQALTLAIGKCLTLSNNKKITRSTNRDEWKEMVRSIEGMLD